MSNSTRLAALKSLPTELQFSADEPVVASTVSFCSSPPGAPDTAGPTDQLAVLTSDGGFSVNFLPFTGKKHNIPTAAM